MSSANFREEARQALKRAKAELETNNSDRLKYAALELRFAMEAVTYDRALAFKEEIPPEQYRTWQPRKLMQLLHDIDPTIGLTSRIAVGIQPERGVRAPPEKMRVLGTDNVLTLSDLKKHYDALGNYLHMLSLAQIEEGKTVDNGRLRSRCENLVAIIEKVLSSKVWNSTLGNFATLDECMNEDCKKAVQKRIPMGKTEAEAKCFECGADYSITSQTDHTVLWRSRMIDVPCADPDCSGVMRIWRHEMKAGTNWTCQKCDQRWVIELGLVPFTANA